MLNPVLFALGVFLVVATLYNQVVRHISLTHQDAHSPMACLPGSAMIAAGICLVTFVAVQ